MIIYINGIAYKRCESMYWGTRCADRDGHDGRHHNSHEWWDTTEAANAAANYCGCCRGPAARPPWGEHGACCAERHEVGEMK